MGNGSHDSEAGVCLRGLEVRVRLSLNELQLFPAPKGPCTFVNIFLMERVLLTFLELFLYNLFVLVKVW